MTRSGDAVQAGSAAQTSDIATHLQLAPGTVTLNIKRLSERGLLVHIPYMGVELTESGKLAATSVVRRHRIVETFLVNLLGYDVKDADSLARSFEHQIPQGIEDRLFAIMDSPARCPHGHDIPAPNASEIGEPVRLTELNEGDAAVIALPDDMDGEVVALLDTLGVRPGVQIQVRENSSKGPVVVRVDGEDRTVGEKLAGRIQVVPGVTTEEAVS